MSNLDSDSVDTIKSDVFQYIRNLEKKKAQLSIFLLVDSFLLIADNFAINPSEYEYYLDKYRDSTRSDVDLTKNMVLDYLLDIILRLEQVTDKKFDPTKLKIHTASLDQSKSLSDPSDLVLEVPEKEPYILRSNDPPIFEPPIDNFVKEKRKEHIQDLVIEEKQLRKKSKA